jgi:transposase
MRRTEALQGVRMAMFLNLLNRWESAELNQAEAAELLGVSERTFRRWRDRYDEDGAAGLVDRRLGKASGRRVPVDRAEEVERLYRERYQGFTVKHFHEHLVKDHGFGWGYTWLKLHLQWLGVVARAPRKGAHRRKRERRPLPGMMLHQDGSRHAWLEGAPALDLIVTLDDATGAIYSAFLVEEEGTASTFRALKEVFSQHGLPMSLYTDRGSHYFRTTKAGEIDRGCPTQVGRALAQLGVEPIGAFSPQTRGRSERAFGTLQDRLVKELRLAGITEVEAANAFIRDVYLPAHNARFAVEPAGESSAFTPIPGVDLDEILCVEEERQVGNDNCVSYRTLKLQIPESPMRPISSGRGSRSTSIPTVPTPSFTDHNASAATTRTAGSRTPSQSNMPLNSARRRACGNGDNAAALPQSHRETKPEEADKPRAKTGQIHSLST